MELSLIKQAIRLTEYQSSNATPVQSINAKISALKDDPKLSKLFLELSKIIPKELETKLLTAWMGDVRSWGRSKGKNFKSLFMDMLNSENVENKFKFTISQQYRNLLPLLGEAIKRILPSSIDSKEKITGKSDGYGAWRENQEFPDLSIDEIEEIRIYENMRKEFSC